VKNFVVGTHVIVILLRNMFIVIIYFSNFSHFVLHKLAPSHSLCSPLISLSSLIVLTCVIQFTYNLSHFYFTIHRIERRKIMRARESEIEGEPHTKTVLHIT